MTPSRPRPPPPGERALLLSCMDLRLLDEIVRELEPLQLTNRYDHVILAGASLGALTAKYPHWGETFRDHLGLARTLHHIKRVIILDHRDCGAYRMILGLKANAGLDREREVHLGQMQSLRRQVNRSHPDLAVELWLMDLDGSIEDLSALPELDQEVSKSPRQPRKTAGERRR